MTKEKLRVLALVIFAVVLILCVWYAGSSWHTKAYEVDSTVVLDADAKVQIEANADGKVIKVTPLNRYGRDSVAKKDFTGVDIDVVVNTLTLSMIRKGYISDRQNRILISVESGNDALAEKLYDTVYRLFEIRGFDGVILAPVDGTEETTEITKREKALQN